MEWTVRGLCKAAAFFINGNFLIPVFRKLAFHAEWQLFSKLRIKEQEWNELFAAYKEKYPELAEQLSLGMKGELPKDWDQSPPFLIVVLFEPARSADPPTKKGIFLAIPFSTFWFGVREFAMGAALNGMALHGGLRVFGGTFFVFSDYLSHFWLSFYLNPQGQQIPRQRKEFS
jgi:transketolase